MDARSASQNPHSTLSPFPKQPFPGFETLRWGFKSVMCISPTFEPKAALPGMLIYAILKKGEIDRDTGLEWLNKLSPFISEDEYGLSKLLLEGES